MTGAFQASEAGRPYKDILGEVEVQLMKVVDRTPQFNVGELSDYEAMKLKLMMEVIPQKGNEDRLGNIPYQKVEDMALKAGNGSTSEDLGCKSIEVHTPEYVGKIQYADRQRAESSQRNL